MSQRPELLIRRLGRRYGIVLAVVATLLLVDQAVLQPLLVRLNLSAPVINLAGRQRMLSQCIAKDALTIALNAEADSGVEGRLGANLNEWRRVHAGLKSGDTALNLAATTNSTIRERLDDLDPLVRQVSTSVDALLARGTAADDAIRRLLAAERSFLPQMDQIVQLFERDAQQQVVRLRATALAATVVVITLMAGLYWLVLSPAVTLIRHQIERLEEHERELEVRVDERTRQLCESNQALEQEATRRAESEQRTFQLQSQLAHASRLNSLGELATGIAHELNQPLGAISNYAETLLILTDSPTPDQGALARSAMRVRESAHRAGAIIRRMRNFVKSRSGPRTLEPLNPLIAEVIDLCEPDLRSRGVRVDLDCGETFRAAAVMDPIQIQQVLVNLIRNAAQAVEFRAPHERQVSVSTISTDAAIEIHVDDNGRGFPEDFELHGATLRSTKPDGLGLGLSISRSIVEAHGGTLLTANQPHGGARVTVLLPLTETARRLEPADGLCC